MKKIKKFYFSILLLFLFSPFLASAETCCVCEYPSEGRNQCTPNLTEAQCAIRLRGTSINCTFKNTECSSQVLCPDYKTPEQQQEEQLQKAKDTANISELRKFVPQISIPGSEFEAGKGVEIVQINQKDGESSFLVTLLPRYIRAIYKYGVWATITLAIFMVMVGGFMWLIAGGSSERVSSAKGIISHAFVGLIIALFSYGILFTLNPDTVNLKTLEISRVVPTSARKACCISEKKEPLYFNATQEVVENSSKMGEFCKQIGDNYSACTDDYIPPCCVCQIKRNGGVQSNGCFYNVPSQEACLPSVELSRGTYTDAIIFTRSYVITKECQYVDKGCKTIGLECMNRTSRTGMTDNIESWESFQSFGK